MMKTRLWVLAVLTLAPAAAPAQNPADSGAPNRARLAELREAVRRRWSQHIRQTLGLTDAQAARLDSTERRYEALRQPVVEDQANIARALGDQLRPGVAADQDSVTRLLDRRRANQARLEKINEQQDDEMAGYLTPVQRARYQRQRQLFLERVREIIRERRGMRPGRAPGRP